MEVFTALESHVEQMDTTFSKKICYQSSWIVRAGSRFTCQILNWGFGAGLDAYKGSHQVPADGVNLCQLKQCVQEKNVNPYNFLSKKERKRNLHDISCRRGSHEPETLIKEHHSACFELILLHSTAAAIIDQK